MSKRQPPTSEAFNKLLLWLGPDLEQGAAEYERIYSRLVRILAAKGCWVAEDLADQTVNIVASRIDELIATYRGDPALYFYGVSKNIYKEWIKPRPQPKPLPPPDTDEIERRCGCLEKCLETLTPEESGLLLRYHEGEGQARIANRKKMAEELGITLNALRIRICHLQARLRPCIEECLQNLDQ